MHQFSLYGRSWGFIYLFNCKPWLRICFHPPPPPSSPTDPALCQGLWEWKDGSSEHAASAAQGAEGAAQGPGSDLQTGVGCECFYSPCQDHTLPSVWKFPPWHRLLLSASLLNSWHIRRQLPLLWFLFFGRKMSLNLTPPKKRSKSLQKERHQVALNDVTEEGQIMVC